MEVKIYILSDDKGVIQGWCSERPDWLKNVSLWNVYTLLVKDTKELKTLLYKLKINKSKLSDLPIIK